MPDKEIGPVGCVVGNSEARVLAEASQLFPAFKTCQTPPLLLLKIVQLASVGT